MIHLGEITERNWLEAASLQLTEEQRAFVASPIGILARGYVYRDCNARVFTIESDGQVVGLAMVRDLTEEPACYELQQFMIDRQHQNRGFGKTALRMILDILKEEARFPRVEVCVKMSDTIALRLYQNAGFVDTGYIDESVPDAYNWVYCLSNDL